MELIKCKMCGGDLELDSNKFIGICKFCGSTMTVPSISDEKRISLYNRANYYRMKCEFDKAIVIYENILSENNKESEAHWGIVLCKYGIEYVEDKKTNMRIPTCHRANNNSIFSDYDYNEALKYADFQASALYEKEAKQIDDLIKQIINISLKEEPYDIFICYKETDDLGERTEDSVIAQDIYEYLLDENMKVFFAKISLENKLGSAYEPCIFAALNSSKVMIVIGTKKEYFESVWVKNEWSRYLTLINNGNKKTIIPVYKNISPYELPNELSHLQAQDASKIGFMQDLIRGINKIVNFDNENENKFNNQSNNNQAEPLLKRAMMFLEDRDFIQADEYFERVLDLDPECAKAYAGKLMVERKKSTEDELKKDIVPLEKSIYYNKIIKFADKALKERYISYNKCIINKSEEIRKKNEEIRKEKARLEAEELERISKIRIEQEKKNRKVLRIVLICSFIIFLSFIIIDTTFSPKIYYDKAIICFKNNEMVQARAYIEKSNEKYTEIFYDTIINDINKNINDENIEKLDIFVNEIKKDKFSYKKYTDMCYKSALKALEDGSTYTANVFLNKVKINDKFDKSFIDECYNKAIEYLEKKDIYTAINYMNYVNVDAKLSNLYREVCYEQANTYLANKDYYKSLDLFKRIIEHKDSIISIRKIINNYFEGCLAMHKGDLIALKADGTCLSSNDKYDVSNFKNIVSLSANDEHIVGLKEDGTVAVFTSNTHEQCSLSNWKEISAICASESGVYGVKRDGTVIAESNTKYPFYDPTKYIKNWTNIIDISASLQHVVGLKSDGTVIAVGLNNYDECNVSEWTDIVSVYAEVGCTVGLKKNGTLRVAGDVRNKDKIEKNWNSIVSIIPNNKFILGLQTDGSIVASSVNNYYDTNVYGWENIVSVSKFINNEVYGLLIDGTFVKYEYFDKTDAVQNWNLIK